MRRRDFIMAAAAAAAAPLAATAQQKAMPVIGWLHIAAPATAQLRLDAFREGLRDENYLEGKNVTIEYRWAEDHADRLPALAADLVGRNVDVIAATGSVASARAAKVKTSTIPIVFTYGADPVADGLVASLARPGGNVTGTSLLTTELNPKRLELLADLVPKTKVFGLLVDPSFRDSTRVVPEMQQAARIRQAQLQVLEAGTDTEIDAAFAKLSETRSAALVVAALPFFNSRRDQLVALAARHAIPTIYALSDAAAAGGLISYGPSFSTIYRLVGIYCGKILKGAKPADLPVQQPTKFELVVNLKTAKTLGLTVPQSILARADEVIE